MKAAYFSTACATGSCNSYSRFTISGGLLMIDMGLLSVLVVLDAGTSGPLHDCFKPAFLPASKMNRRAKRNLCRGVICVFHAAFTCFLCCSSKGERPFRTR